MKITSNYIKFSLVFIGLIVITELFSQYKQIPEDYQKKLLTPEYILTDYKAIEPLSSVDNYDILMSMYLGDSLFSLGKLALACDFYNKGLSLSCELNLPWHKILFYNRLGFTNRWMLNKIKSEEYYLYTIIELQKYNTIKDTLAVLEALLFLSETDKLKYSNRYNAKDFDDKGIVDDRRRIKYKLLHTILLEEDGNYFEQLNELNQMDNLIAKSYTKATPWQFYVDYYLAEAYYFTRQENLAKKFLEELENKINKNPEYRCYNYYVYNMLSNFHLRAKRYNLANEYSQKYFSLIEMKTHPSFHDNHLLLGRIREKLGQNQKAYSFYKRAEEILHLNGIKDERLAKLYWYLATFYKNTGDSEQLQLNYLHQAEDILKKYPGSYLEPYVVYELGMYYYRNQDYDLSIIIFNQILDDLDKLLLDSDYFKTRYPYLVTSPYLDILKKRGYAFYFHSASENSDFISMKHSYSDLKDLLNLKMKMFNELSVEKSKEVSLRDIRSTYNDLINVGYNLYEVINSDSIVVELFDIAEKSRAHILKSYISDDLAKKMAGIPEELIKESKTLKKEIDSLQYSLQTVEIKSTNQAEQLRISKILEKYRNYDKYIAELEKKFPKYAELKGTYKNISIHQVQKLLDPSQALIEYQFNFNAFFIFYIDKDSVRLICEPITSDFPLELINYRDSFLKTGYNKFEEGAIKNFARQSYKLYKLILKPVEDLIGNKRLIIVPDGELSLIPFETLVTENIDSVDLRYTYSNLPYLIFKNPVSYLYSASQLTEKPEINKNRITYSGFAPDYSSVKINGSASDSLCNSIDILPGAYEEVVSAKKYFRGNYFSGSDANKNNFFRSSLKSDIIHLAMHTVIDNEEPMNSKLLFSPDYDKDEEQLHAYEVYSRKIKASMVVLSACNTGSGKVSKGEGVISIARAFLLAGVKNIIITQWSIADKSSVKIMDCYYYHLSKGDPVDVALQKSKINFLTKGDPVKAHPYYWAGFVSVGNSVSYISRRNTWLIYIFFALVIVFGVFWIKRKLNS